MLQRIYLELIHGLGSPFQPGPDDLAPFEEMVDFIQGMSHDDVDGYYLVCEFRPSI
jgi:hypothetical protein